jgi:hypothetical protein
LRRSITLLAKNDQVDFDDSFLASYLFTGLVTAQIRWEKWELLIAGAGGSHYVQYGYADGEEFLIEITTSGWQPVQAR